MCVLFSISLFGCNYNFNKNTLNKTIFNKSKPTNYYYTQLLMKDLSLKAPTQPYALYMNFYRKKDFTKDDLTTVSQFFNSLTNESFITKPEGIPAKPIYKIFLTFSENKYVINIYDEKYVSISPWDGDFIMDYIDTSKMYKAYNLYGLCKYLMPQ